MGIHDSTKPTGVMACECRQMRWSILLKEIFFSKALITLPGACFLLWIFQSNGFNTGQFGSRIKVEFWSEVDDCSSSLTFPTRKSKRLEVDHLEIRFSIDNQSICHRIPERGPRPSRTGKYQARLDEVCRGSPWIANPGASWTPWNFITTSHSKGRKRAGIICI